MKRISLLLVLAVFGAVVVSCNNGSSGAKSDGEKTYGSGGGTGGGSGYSGWGSQSSPTPEPSPTTHKVDILFVVDDSGSMESHQTNLAKNVDQFIAGLQKWTITDYHIGVVTTDMKAPNRKGQMVSTNKTGPRWVDSATPNVEKILKVSLTPGVSGWSQEQALAAAMAAVLPPNSEGSNKGFLRDDAEFALIIISDAESQESDPIEGIIDTFKTVKGGKADAVHVFGMAALDGTGCPKDEDESPQLRIREFYAKTSATVYNLCAPDFGDNLGAIGRSISGLFQ